MSATMSIDSELREKVLKVPGTILFTEFGAQDRVLRVEGGLDEIVPNLAQILKNEETPCLVVNLDKGPGQERWSRIKGILQSRCRRDRPIPEPRPVSVSTKDGWSLRETDVPVAEIEESKNGSH